MREGKDLSALHADCTDFLQSHIPVSGLPQIAAWGLLKAGKSSLLNMISGHLKDDFFETGATRTTHENKSFEMEGYVLMDTPGLDCDQGDSREAFKGLESADVILFVHAPPGELDQSEIDLLIQAQNSFGDKAERRVILILSNLDRYEKTHVDDMRNSIIMQVRKHVGIEPVFFAVSNTMYKKGAPENKTALIKESGIPSLLQHLDALSDELKDRVEDVRRSRHNARQAKLLSELDDAIEAENKILSSLKAPFIQKMQTLNGWMMVMEKDFATQAAEIKAAKEKMSNL